MMSGEEPSTAATWDTAYSLSAQVKARRAELVRKAHPFVKSIYTKELVATTVEKCADKWGRKAARERFFLPTMSADFFNWSVEKASWEFLMSKAKLANPPPFPYASQEPKRYGSPYSEIFLSHLADLEQDTEVTAETREMDTDHRVRASAIETLGKLPPVERSPAFPAVGATASPSLSA
ncbi:hypothetical protein F5B19DRAFT_200970 [Rostrohypoxylon terebratum]|nr:hypothetical protein F5B19DRAFT_200970 [Rostrohypoxylon terebratum]